MQNRMKYLFAGSVIFVLLAGVIYLLNRNKTPFYSWSESYRFDKKDPYGCYMIYNLLEGFFEQPSITVIKKPLSKVLPQDREDVGNNYIFIGKSFYSDQTDLDELFLFIARGNNAFISVQGMSSKVLSGFCEALCLDSSKFLYHRDTSIIANFTLEISKSDTGFFYRYYYNNQPENYNWFYVGKAPECNETYAKRWLVMHPNIHYLGYMNNLSQTNFLKIPIGKGMLYLHTTPLAFTNYYMVQKRGKDYAERVFSYLPKGKVYWDAFDKIPSMPKKGSPQESNPLRYILSQPPLRWAWYLALFLVLLYVLFYMRRQQRIIPVKEANVNTSLEFIQTVGNLYLQQSNHKKTAEKIMHLFINKMKNRYHLQALNEQQKMINAIAMKSNVKREEVEKIFKIYKVIEEAETVSEYTLIHFHKSIEEFYDKAK